MYLYMYHCFFDSDKHMVKFVASIVFNVCICITNNVLNSSANFHVNGDKHLGYWWIFKTNEWEIRVWKSNWTLSHNITNKSLFSFNKLAYSF